MSTSLLLALLEAHEPNEPDRSRDYYNWIRAQWDGTKWNYGSSERRDLMLRELYEVLRSTININMTLPYETMPAESGALGTVLARTLTDDQRPGLPAAAKRLRAALKRELLKRLDALIANHSGQNPVHGFSGSDAGSSVNEELSRLREDNQRLRRALNILTSESK
jgi:hypothetical protein